MKDEGRPEEDKEAPSQGTGGSNRRRCSERQLSLPYQSFAAASPPSMWLPEETKANSGIETSTSILAIQSFAIVLPGTLLKSLRRVLQLAEEEDQEQRLEDGEKLRAALDSRAAKLKHLSPLALKAEQGGLTFNFRRRTLEFARDPKKHGLGTAYFYSADKQKLLELVGLGDWYKNKGKQAEGHVMHPKTAARLLLPDDFKETLSEGFLRFGTLTKDDQEKIL